MLKLFNCLLSGGKIDSDFCLEIQECVDGITEPTIETEEFLNFVEPYAEAEILDGQREII